MYTKEKHNAKSTSTSPKSLVKRPRSAREEPPADTSGSDDDADEARAYDGLGELSVEFLESMRSAMSLSRFAMRALFDQHNNNIHEVLRAVGER